MSFKKSHIIFFLSAIFLCLAACVEPFDFEELSAENVLVVEAVLTDFETKQTVLLSRVANLQNVNTKEDEVYNANTPFKPIDESRSNPEHNAKVQIVDDLGNVYIFSEVGTDGIYESQNMFGAVSGRTYQLQIIANGTDEYVSNFSGIIGKSQINKVYAERIINENEKEGMAIFVDGSDAKGISNYFRYTYEETYKIIAPNWSPRDLKIIRENIMILTGGSILYPEVELVTRSQEEQVCFKTEHSANINLISTIALNNANSERNLIRFIPRNNPILSHRYSILVKQYTQSTDAFSYYESLRNFTTSESVFSEVQPGFLEGNIKAINSDQLVVGYFDVVSISEKRIFFNYDDYFLGEDLPPYFFDFNCDRLLSPPLGNPYLDGPTELNCPQGLVPRLKLGLVDYVTINGSPAICEGPYFVTPSICGDCTILGSNVVPDFWTE